jgi:hypothetical protein
MRLPGGDIQGGRFGYPCAVRRARRWVIGYAWTVGILRAVVLSTMRRGRGRTGSRCGTRWAGVLLVAGMLPLAVKAQAAVDPVALVRRAMQLRLEEEKSHRPVEYVLRKTDGNHETSKHIIETRDGDVARLIEINGRPLNADQEKAEMSRLDTLAEHPEMQQRRRRSEQRDAARIDQLVGMLPDSELYKMEGMVACGSGQCYRLSFTPNPGFVPPDIEADVLRGFAGEVWIDQAEDRLVRLDAHLVRDVNIGFGILGRLDKGGTLELQQAYVKDAREWQPTVLKMNLSGRALMVKTLSIQIDELASGFAPVPPELGYREAIAMLKRPGTVAAQR